jgi:hypothetical protein
VREPTEQALGVKEKIREGLEGSNMTLREYKAMTAAVAAHLLGGWRPRGFVYFGPTACPNMPHLNTPLNFADYITNSMVSGQQQSQISLKRA